MNFMVLNKGICFMILVIFHPSISLYVYNMKAIGIVAFILLMTSCSFYKYKSINLKKASPVEVCDWAVDTSSYYPADIFVHVGSIDNKAVALKNHTIGDTSILFGSDGSGMSTWQKKYFDLGREKSSTKGKRKVSIKMNKEDLEYVEQVHFVIDSLKSPIADNYTLTDSDVSEMVIVSKNDFLSFLYALLIVLGGVAVLLLIVFVAYITTFNPLG